MLFYIPAILVATISHALAWQVEVPSAPVTVSSCTDNILRSCPQLPAYMTCAKFYKPLGRCCPVCACEDKSGKTYTAGSTFIINKDFHCWQCQCEMRNGALNARCYRKYCPTLECPPDSQVKEKGSCCSKCKSGWVKPIRTFPPFPGGGFPQPGGGFPQPGGGFPQPGAGFPPFGDEGKIEDISERKSMKKKEE